MTLLTFDLPDCPQVRTLRGVLERLAGREGLRAIWIGGSFACGSADKYSDVDLRLAVDKEAYAQWMQVDLRSIFDDPCPGNLVVFQGAESALYHILLSNGELFDLFIQTYPPTAIESRIVMLEVSETSIQEEIESKIDTSDPAVVEATGTTVEQLIRGFWVNSHKHRKVLDRDLDLMAHIGINSERDVLRRLWYISLTGLDEPRAKTIHTLTAQIRAISEGIGGHAFSVLGMPLRTRTELIEAIEAIRGAVSKVGRKLAAKYDFEYPADLEEVVLKGWRAWCPIT